MSYRRRVREISRKKEESDLPTVAAAKDVQSTSRRRRWEVEDYAVGRIMSFTNPCTPALAGKQVCLSITQVESCYEDGRTKEEKTTFSNS